MKISIVLVEMCSYENFIKSLLATKTFYSHYTYSYCRLLLIYALLKVVHYFQILITAFKGNGLKAFCSFILV